MARKILHLLTYLLLMFAAQAVDAALTDVYLTLTPIDSSQFGMYTLTASNVVDSTWVNLELIQDSTSNATLGPQEDNANLTLALGKLTSDNYFLF